MLAGTPWRDLEAPEEVRAVPTMLSPQEQALLYTLARDHAGGEGAIVDAGCFLGGSSAALLAGVRDRPAPWTGPPVASYDQFLVEEYTLDQFFSDMPGVRVGDSFRSRYDRNVAGYGVPHDVHEGDVAEIGWPGGPIDVLFLDLLKTWEINDAVLHDFFPHVVPGRTVLVHQDYGWGQLPWLQMTVELMRDSLRWLDAVGVLPRLSRRAPDPRAPVHGRPPARRRRPREARPDRSGHRPRRRRIGGDGHAVQGGRRSPEIGRPEDAAQARGRGRREHQGSVGSAVRRGHCASNSGWSRRGAAASTACSGGASAGGGAPAAGRAALRPVRPGSPRAAPARVRPRRRAP